MSLMAAYDRWCSIANASRSLLLDRNVLILVWDSSNGAHINMLSRMSPYYLGGRDRLY